MRIVSISKKLLPVFLLAFVLPRILLAADTTWSVHAWQVPDSSNNYVTGITQSPDGYLWVATSAGLNRFDGVRFTLNAIGKRYQLPSVNVRATYRLRDGRLCAVFDGAVIICAQDQLPIVIRQNLSSTRIETIAEDPQGVLWLSYHQGDLCRIENNLAAPVQLDTGTRTTPLILAATSTQLWVHDGGHLGTIENGKFNLALTLPGLSAMTPASDGQLWLCADYQLYKFNAKQGLQSIAPLPFRRPNPEALVLFEDHQNVLWLGTQTGGLFRFNGKTFDPIRTSQAHITCISEDQEGSLWVGTDAGIDRVSPAVVTLQGQESGLPVGGATSVCMTSDGSIYAAANDGALMTETGGIWTRAPISIPDSATCVAADINGGLWIGAKNYHLYRWKDNTLKVWGAADGLQRHGITALLSASNGDLWIGSAGSAVIQRFSGEKFINLPTPISMGQVGAMAEDHHGNIYFTRTGKGGVYRVIGDQVSSLMPSDAFAPAHALCVMPDDSVWVAFYSQGLARITDGKISPVMGVPQGLADNNISVILPDSQGWLWFGSDDGIFKIEAAQLAALADGKISHVLSFRYGWDQEVPPVQAKYGVYPNALRDRQGRMLLATATGLLSIWPQFASVPTPPPQVHIERVLQDDRATDVYAGILPPENFVPATRQTVSLSGNYHVLEFDFTALSFLVPSSVQFEYQIPGIDDHWRQTSDRHAIYPQLPPGDYQFTVRACNSNGVWNEAGATLSVVAVPMLWQRWWFQAAIILAFTVIIVALARYISLRRLRARLRLLEHQSALAKERTRIARDLHDDLGARLTNIIMDSERTLRESNGKLPSSDILRRIAGGMRGAVRALDETVWAVNPRNDDLSSMIDYIGQSSVEFLSTASIRCRVQLFHHSSSVSISAEIRHNVLLSVKEVLNNVVRHANAREVRLHTSIAGRLIHLTIEDDGQGFEMPAANATADGLRNMQQRMDDIGGRCEILSRPDLGTRVSLIFPLSHSLN